MAKGEWGSQPTSLQHRGHKLDWSTISGLVLGVGSILTGLKYDGGNINDLLHLDSFLIVFGATIGASLIATSHSTVKDLFYVSRVLFVSRAAGHEIEIEKIRRFTRQLRSWNNLKTKETVLDHDLSAFVFLNDVEELDDLTPNQVRFWTLRMKGREIRTSRIDNSLRFGAGAAPAFGVAGAIFGLMHVMHNLHGDIGPGIARAFTATIYGIILTNFVLLPAAEKIAYRLSVDQCFAVFWLRRIETVLISAAKQTTCQKATHKSIRKVEVLPSKQLQIS